MTLIAATTIDGNNNIVLLACAPVPIENKKWWTWFLSFLSDAFDVSEINEINDDEAPVMLISNADNGLKSALKPSSLKVITLCAGGIWQKRRLWQVSEHKRGASRCPWRCSSYFTTWISKTRIDGYAAVALTLNSATQRLTLLSHLTVFLRRFGASHHLR